VNCAVTTEEFVFDVDEVCSRPGTDWMAASIGLETSLATTAGAAPG
jgi:hypothetical protein